MTDRKWPDDWEPHRQAASLRALLTRSPSSH
jgi:hypothetical protein